MNDTDNTIAVKALIQELRARYGRKFDYQDAFEPFWMQELAGFSVEQIQGSVRKLARMTFFPGPTLDDVVKVIGGVWDRRRLPRLNANLQLDSSLGYETVLLRCDGETGAVIHAFDELGQLLDWPSRHPVYEQSKVPKAIKPPESLLLESASAAPAIQAPSESAARSIAGDIEDIIEHDPKDWT